MSGSYTCIQINRCLDVRTNDQGDLVVTKGDQYDVRDTSTSDDTKGNVRNLGKPVDLCKRYYEEVRVESSLQSLFCQTLKLI